MILSAVNWCSFIALLNLIRSSSLAAEMAPPLPRVQC
jgi:hypothetical protein